LERFEVEDRYAYTSVTPCWGILQTPLDRPKSLTDIQLTDPLVAQCGQPSAVRIALTDLWFAHVGMANRNEAAAPSGWFAPSAGDQVRRFLIESERRVIVHCRKLLDDQNLPTEDHRRLTRLLGQAEARLQALASQAAMQN
jgi:hypothetical protein